MVNSSILSPREREEILVEIDQLNRRIQDCVDNRKAPFSSDKGYETWLIQGRIYHEMRNFLKEIIIKNRY
jgi:hypothetical protein